MDPVDNSINTIRTQKTAVDQGARSNQGAGVSGAPRDASANSVAADSTAESVSFTQTAADLLQLETQLRSLPGIDQARVDSIREAIDDGTYEINAERIVENLLKSERELR